jgi:tRNA 2-thiouridine synthesizing protein A
LLKPVSERMFVVMGERLIDAQYQKSPIPVLRAAKALRGMEPGEKLRVLATDPGAVADFREFCLASGHALIAASESRGVFSFSVKRGEAP